MPVTATRFWMPLIALVLLASGSADAAGVEWRTDYAAAAKEAAAKNKPLLVKFTAVWCTYCHKMERTTFKDPGVVEHVNTCFIPVKVDADANERLMKSMGVRALPTTVFLSPQGKVLERLRGYKRVDALSAQLTAVCPLKRAEPAGTAVVSLPPAKPAFGGNCLVSLRDGRKLAKGDPAITTTYRNTVIAFASAEARAKFVADPVRYWPMWDGRCPVTAVEEGRSVEGLPVTGAIYRDRLWFFSDRDHRKAFDETPTRFLPTVAAKPGPAAN